MYQLAQPVVEIRAVSYVKPSKPTKRHGLYLSDLDLVFGNLPYMRHLYFYKNVEHERDPVWFESVCGQLKSSLSSTLNHFYPLAGRFTKTSAGTRPVLDCNDEGAEFIEASADAALTNFEEKGFPIHKIFEKFTGLADFSRCDLPGTPLMCLQVTKLQDGGFVLGFAMSHVVVDGHSFWYFLESWSKISRNVEGGHRSILQPLHMRSVLKRDVLSLYSPYYVDANDNKIGGHLVKDADGGLKEDHHGRPHRNEINDDDDKEHFHELRRSSHAEEELRQVILHFPFDVVQQIKAMCSTPGRSTLEAMLAYLWQSLTMAQRLEASQKVCLFIPINIRQKLLPPLTHAFFGNAIAPTIVQTTCGHLLSQDVDAIATLIHEAIACVDDNFIKKHLISESSGLAIGRLLQGCVVTNVGNSPNFPCYSVDLGWGKPVAVRPVATPREGILDFYPSPPSCPNGSIDLCLGISKPTLDNLSSLGSIIIHKNEMVQEGQ